MTKFKVYDKIKKIELSNLGHREIAKLLVENGGDVNAKDNNETALILAARAGNFRFKLWFNKDLLRFLVQDTRTLHNY